MKTMKGCGTEAAEEAQRQAVEALLKASIGQLVIPEAYGRMFPVTPFIAWDRGELRDFVAYAVRNRYSTKAACARMATLCEHTFLRALVREPKERR